MQDFSRAQDGARVGSSIAAGNALYTRACGDRDAQGDQRGDVLNGAVDPGWGIMKTKSKAHSRLKPIIGLAGALLMLLPPVLLATDIAWLPTLAAVAILAWQRASRRALIVAGAAALAVLATPTLDLMQSLVPLAALSLLAILAQRPRRRGEPVVRGRFESILEHSDLLTLVTDEQDATSYANPAFLRLLGIDLDALVGRPAIELFHVDDRETLAALLAATRVGEAAITRTDAPLRLAVANGDHAYLQARINRIEGGPERGSIVMGATEVTERVRAESALAGSETRFASLFATSRDALLITRREDGVIVDFNDALTTLTGWSRDEGLGNSINQVVPLADPSDLGTVFSLLDRDGEYVEYDTAIVRRDGRVIEITMSGRYAEIDGHRCVVAVLRDITENRRTEMALAESEHKFSSTFHRSPDAMSIVRLADGVVVDVNERFTQLFQRRTEDIVGRAVMELQPTLDLDRLVPMAELASRDTEGAEFANVEVDLKIDDRTVPTLVSTTIAEINGQPCAVSLIKDMSELERARRALEDSEARFRGAFEHAPIGMMLIDPERGRITQVNRVLCDLLGYDPQVLLKKRPASLLPSEDRAEHDYELAALQSGTETEISRETRYLRADGEAIWTNRHVVLQRAPDGTPVHIIVQITDVTDLKNSREQMEKLAFYDTLTGLANRRLFTDRLEQAVRHAVRTGRPTALMYLDLDNFKRVNDSLGHEAGDELLRGVAGRLQQCVREEDTVGRFGGDEFTILLNQVRDSRAAGRVARKVLTALVEPIVIANHEFRVTTSIGVTLAPDDGIDPATLIKNADLAMYRAKERGRDNYQFFSEDMNTRAMDRLILENELRGALGGEEFELFYQPQVSVDEQKIAGMEALLRWRHPRRGLLATDNFIHVAEESGLIVPLGEWTIRKACEQIRILRNRTGSSVRIAVNISARQFSDPNLPDVIEQALRASALDPASLELEITETMLMHDIEEAIAMLERLHGIGVSLAVDDFGTGYSSLNYLKRLPIDRVKVDQSFVSDIPDSEDDVAITSAVIAMAHQLKLDVVAEGVETHAQLEFLAAANCELAQGFLFGEPLPFEEAKAIVGQYLFGTGGSETGT